MKEVSLQLHPNVLFLWESVVDSCSVKTDLPWQLLLVQNLADHIPRENPDFWSGLGLTTKEKSVTGLGLEKGVSGSCKSGLGMRGTTSTRMF